MEEGRRPNYVSLALGEVQDRLHTMQGGCSSDGEEKEGSGGDRERGGGDRGHGVSRASPSIHGQHGVGNVVFLAC
jgi:hypothetical protein